MNTSYTPKFLHNLILLQYIRGSTQATLPTSTKDTHKDEGTVVEHN